MAKNGGAKQTKLLDRFLKAKPEFKQFKMELATDLHERIEKLKKETGMSAEAVNEALNYAIRGLVTRLEREAKAGAGAK
jgi:hypothetical protein